MLQSYLTQLLELFDEDLIQSFQIRIITVHSVCSVLDFKFMIQS